MEDIKIGNIKHRYFICFVYCPIQLIRTLTQTLFSALKLRRQGKVRIEDKETCAKLAQPLSTINFILRVPHLNLSLSAQFEVADYVPRISFLNFGRHQHERLISNSKQLCCEVSTTNFHDFLIPAESNAAQ